MPKNDKAFHERKALYMKSIVLSELVRAILLEHPHDHE